MTPEIEHLNLSEHLARIDLALAQHDRLRQEKAAELAARFALLQSDHERRLQETRFAPWQLALGGMAAGAALLGAVLLLLKALGA
jgi:hypothetical protein